jgi:hypothetical protein
MIPQDVGVDSERLKAWTQNENPNFLILKGSV